MPVVSYKFNPVYNKINYKLSKTKKKELNKLNILNKQTTKLVEIFRINNPNTTIVKTELTYGYFHIYYK